MSIQSQHQLRVQFRELMKGDTCFDAGSVFDPMSARIAGDLGFEVGILGGSVAALQVLAAPDFALVTMSEFVEQATRIGRVAQLPVIADADHGYGNALNAMRTVTELERSGISMMTLEDTLLPAQYGHKSTDLIGTDEMVGKLRAAIEARIDPDFSIFARTNANVLDDDQLIERIKRYQAAGADGICIVGIRDVEHLERVTADVKLPIMLIAYGNPKLRDLDRLASLGVRIVVNGHAAYFASIKATYDMLREQRGIKASDLSASELSSKYSTLEEYRIWAREYMDVKE
ncbi:isocitrate lyase/PEP mutase family protein [Carnimonas bestiolae]|uniref:isocitrate lyase/PEP mutase family protein n=1 Tax=Carnimonas bestiolae TaxID=3402172 RepID=UPI003EDC7851